MTNYLVIENDTIVNIIVADTLQIAEEVTGKEVAESTSDEIGIGWSRSNGEWAKPEIMPILHKDDIK
jgi:hypothetical protein